MIIRMNQKALAGSDLQALQKERQRVMVPPKHNTKNIMGIVIIRFGYKIGINFENRIVACYIFHQYRVTLQNHSSMREELFAQIQKTMIKR